MKNHPDVEKVRTGSADSDAERLAEMGYSQDMKRNFSVWSVLGVGFSLTNSWWGVSAALITGVNSGGPCLLVYGTILLALVSVGVAVSLSELASAMPNAAGQIFWAAELAPRRYARVASYITGWLAWAGSICASASVALSISSAAVGCYQLSHPDFEIKTWHVIVCYQLANAFIFLFNCVGKLLPTVASISLYTTLISFAVILIAVPASAETHQDPKFVFATFINNTGWAQDGIAVIVGLINVNWGFSCLDTAIHLAEEVHSPEKMVPIAIMGTVTIGFITSFGFIISMLFSLTNFELVSTTVTGVPMLELFYQALGHKGGAIALEALIICTGSGCLAACHTWSSRLCWSFARDGGLPYSNFLARIHPRLDVPFNAHATSSLLASILGCLYLASTTAFNSILSGCIVLPYLSYSIPITCLLIRGRENIAHGPFWLGRFGLVSNIVLLCWVLFTFVMYSFPAYQPVEADNMNYVSVVYGIVFLVAAVDWFLRGNKSFQPPLGRHDEIEGVPA
ncbi:hypothetical protein BHE90_015285 [Fusarium euwallaceae]|uniref:Choline transport protein n=2 Tax=Fusarium solani species complex TaxID=232080 RepID=A0A3M2RNK5_9HYPO|nr:hypothetical protein CDV36_013622 [Fusarium kuroshium]RTE70317.1 hypothetical protein BHE90_015285 [Fusarium euwallaceae]